MDRIARTLGTLSLAGAMALTISIAFSLPASAQPAGLNPGRDCQVVRTCNFARGAEVRGCLSSYSCRSCRFVKARCTVGNRSGRCEELVCRWGG